MKKGILVYTIIALLLISMTGCESKKEDVKLKSKKEIVQYASKNYGKANYISEQSGYNLINFTLQDKEYKFNYECTSSVKQFCLDASCSNLYYETTTCNFDDIYEKYILNTLNLDNIYNGSHYPSSDEEFTIALKYNDEEIAKKNIQDIAKKITKIDNRKYFSNYYIYIFDNYNKKLFTYNVNENKYFTQ